MVEGGAKCIKYLMFFFNFIFFLSGIAIIIGGALVFTQYNDYVKFTKSLGEAIPIFLLVVGVFVVCTGFLGCWGSIRENYCMVAMFAVIIVILLLAELGGGIAGYVLRDDIKSTIEDSMNETLDEYFKNNATKTLLDNLQQDFKCCGVDSYKDWYQEYKRDEVPKSCCKNETGTCPVDPPVEKDIYTKGCLDALYDFLEKNIVVIAGIAIAIAVVQIFGVVCACCLMRSIKSEYEVV
ncbi:CD63 antigen-like [Patiria miniata]|uniref:Tetraspanin n=1 Tax=Patiria miniata TaxID=46514 RepID=A0A913ZAP8_PATMI|nr:CD63 antigen-like [Patiria miniata]